MKLAQLTRTDHAGVRIDPARAAASAATVHLVPLVADEIRTVARQFPVFLAKDAETGAFYPAALMGLEPHENLFWNGNALEADVLPLNLLRLPFFVGGEGEDSVICIDTESPAIDPSGPCPIVAPDGSESDYFRSVQAILGRLVQGQEPTRRLVDLMLTHKVVREYKLDLAFHDGSTSLLTGLYGIDEVALARAREAITDFADLMILAAMCLSHDHVGALVRRRNARLAAQADWFAPGA
ncbi:SapC family protein [Novosphingobium pokkalii]|uniref:SapC family protein n=1 Tax=Novosphingobium pokkalii TaxID=1770194 RepID=A0ABV7V859_9SPHN|nr:SapC family protein [Novosphingobium pokkalii]GHC96610.1 hypothetical protein GCM10019060_26710 [Novosphingobium pokkalii]